MIDTRQKRISAGATLIVLGLGFFLLQFVDGLIETMIFLLMGALFLAGYLHGRSFAFLVSGCLLMGIGLGSAGERLVAGESNSSAIGLGIGFVAIYLIHRIYTGETTIWPLVPGLILVGGGIMTSVGGFELLLRRGWPLILVLVGFLIILGSSRQRHGRGEQSPTEKERRDHVRTTPDQ